MKASRAVFIIMLAAVASAAFYWKTQSFHAIWIGAFLSDSPRAVDIQAFQKNFGKKPYLVSVFVDWNYVLEPELIGSVYGQGSVLVVTWEPWDAQQKKGIDFDGLLSGAYDDTLRRFSEQLKNIDRPVYFRFAHEMNGNWYPWSGVRLGAEKYIRVWRYVRDKFETFGAKNVKWIFCVNAEDVPRENNHFIQYYPGDAYVDFIGIDGYNWGNSREDSRWQSFSRIFRPFYQESLRLQKPVLITEFSSTSSGGSKADWIREALAEMKSMHRLKGFVLFNIDKETDWRFSSEEASGQALRQAVKDRRFVESVKPVS